MENVWIQFIITGGTVITGMFLTIRYAIKETNKGKDNFLKFLDDMNRRQLDYYEEKNGHLERISDGFTKAIDRNTRAINSLTKKYK